MDELNHITKECKFCYSEIDARAKVCKHCLRSQQVFSVNWVTLIKVILIIIAVVLLLSFN